MTIPRGSLLWSGFADSPIYCTDRTGALLTPPDPTVHLGDATVLSGCNGFLVCPGTTGYVAASYDGNPTGATLQILDPTLVTIGHSVHTPPANFLGIGNTGIYVAASGSVYGLSYPFPSGPWYIVKLSAAGALLQTWVLTTEVAGANLEAVAVNPGETVFYYVESRRTTATNGPIRAWDLVGNTDLGIVINEGTGSTAPGCIRQCVCVAGTGDIFVAWGTGSPAGALDEIRRYSSSGAYLQHYVPPGYLGGITLAFDVTATTDPAPTDETRLICSYYSSAPGYGVSYATVRVSDGAILEHFDTPNIPITYNDGSTGNFEWDGPMTVARVAIAVSGPTITSVTPPLCGDAVAVRTITISGSAFPVTPTVTLTDPHATGIPSTIVSATATTIVVTAVVAVCGTWTATVGTSAPFAFTTASPATYVIRRLRRVMLPWDEAHRWKFISRLELIAQAGIGDSVTTDPVVMLRLSKDGGSTWGPEHHLHAGQTGEYLRRLSVRRLGRARNPVVELTTTDPVSWQWVELLVDLDEGTS